jgi:replicative DNA helicase
MTKKLKLPPQNIEAEESVLGSLMLDKNAIVQVADILKPEDFYQPAHAKIYEAILKLYDKRHPIDLLSVTACLKEDDFLKEIGGSSYLSQLIASVPTAAHVDHYARIVKEKKVLRDLINTSAEITEKAFASGDDVENVLDEVEQKIFAISQRSLPAKFVHIKEGLQDAYNRFERLSRGETSLRGLSTGFTELDNLLSGLQKSDLVIIGARPSLGKTALALDIARNVAAKEERPVAIFSLEMSTDQVIDRLLAAESQVPLWRLRTGKITDETDYEMIQAALDNLSRVPIYIDDAPSPNVLHLRSMARRLQAENDIGLIIIDYLQLIQPRTAFDSMVQQVTEVSRGLKALARELEVPVVAISQLSRHVEQREIKIPRLADLRESGSLEQDADVVLFIYRKDRDKINASPEEQNTAEIIIAKHRNGPLGTVRLKFDPDKVSFQNIDKLHTDVA